MIRDSLRRIGRVEIFEMTLQVPFRLEILTAKMANVRSFALLLRAVGLLLGILLTSEISEALILQLAL